MINQTKYQTIKESKTVVNGSGQAYPDILTFPINRFQYQNSQFEATLTSMDIERFDLFIFSYYQTPDYTDIVLWLNNVATKHDLTVGDTILLPDTEDISRFYLRYK